MTDKIIWVYANYVVTDRAKGNGGLPAQHKELYQPYVPLSTVKTLQKQLDEARMALDYIGFGIRKKTQECTTTENSSFGKSDFFVAEKIAKEALQKIEKLEE